MSGREAREETKERGTVAYRKTPRKGDDRGKIGEVAVREVRTYCLISWRSQALQEGRGREKGGVRVRKPFRSTQNENFLNEDRCTRLTLKRSTVFCALLTSRHAKKTRTPLQTSLSQVSSPMPLVPPVTTATFPHIATAFLLALRPRPMAIFNTAPTPRTAPIAAAISRNLIVAVCVK
eukprot:356953-Rhodomonas_salina.5